MVLSEFDFFLDLLVIGVTNIFEKYSWKIQRTYFLRISMQAMKFGVDSTEL